MSEGIDAAIASEDFRGTSAEPMYSGVRSFYRRRYSKDLSGVDLAVTGIPFDCATTGRPGARLGPEAIRRASALLAWDAPWPWGRDPFAELAVADFGDCLLDPGRPETVVDSILGHARGVLSRCAMLALGGDHFVSYPLLLAHAERHGRLALVHFDAHCDTWPDDGRRLDHGTMFGRAVAEGIVDPGRSIQVGIRTHGSLDRGIEVIDAIAATRMGPQTLASEIKRRVSDGPAYISFDIDALDPAYAPGTGTPVCGGLSTLEAREILLALAGVGLVGADIVEVSPPYDHAEITALAAATLACDLVCLYAESPLRRRAGGPRAGERRTDSPQ